MRVFPPPHCGGQSVWGCPLCGLVRGEEKVSGPLGRSGSHFGWVCADSGQCVLLCISAGFLFHLLPADSEGEGEGEV